MNHFKKLILLFPLLYLIHDIEEIITIEPFLKEHSNIIPVSVTAYQFASAFAILWVITAIGCLQAVQNKKFLGMNPVTFFSFLVPGILLANGIGHVLQFIFFREYVPGFITTILIIFPYSLFTLRNLLREKLIDMKKFLFMLVLGVIIQGPIAFAALFISKVVLN